MKYAFIVEHRESLEISRLCDLLDVSRSGYYAWLRRDSTEKQKSKNQLKRDIDKAFIGSRETYGAPRVHQVITGMHDVSVGTVARRMREMGLKARGKRRFKVVTTDSKHSLPVAENKLEQNFVAAAPNTVWLSDITYVDTAEGWLYVTSILDLCTRKIVGWNFSTSLAHEGVMAALEMAVKQQKPYSGLIFHSDRGVQYACKEFREKLAALHFVQSMSRKGNCYDNAPMESFFHTLKTEFVHHVEFATIEEAKRAIFEWIECFYNRQRLHSSIDYKTPIAKEESFMIAKAA